MEEKILNARKGLMPLMLLVAAFALSVIALIAGISLVENNTLGGVLIAISVAWLSLGWIPCMGVKVLKPQPPVCGWPEA